MSAAMRAGRPLVAHAQSSAVPLRGLCGAPLHGLPAGRENPRCPECEELIAKRYWSWAESPEQSGQQRPSRPKASWSLL